jgi:dTDP-4-dehydrorhamnose reductase
MKVVVIGSKGMLGVDLVNELNKNGTFEVVAFDYSNLDITKEVDMKQIADEKPDFLINCAAYTNVDLAETEKDKCFLVNVEGVKNLVKTCNKINSVLVQISTDYVFDGNKESYDEEDEKNPCNYYGKTKADAENYVSFNLNKYYIIRTSWLFGKNGKNFVDTICKLANEKNELKVVNDQIGRPTYTIDLSKSLIQLLLAKKPFGIYNITNSGKCSWFEFAKKIIELTKLNCAIKSCTTFEYPRPAKRPKCSVLNNNKFDQMRSWELALKDYLGVI